MKLPFFFSALLAFSLAETGIQNEEHFEDLVAVETMDLVKESQDLSPAASAYNYIPSNQNYVPPNQNYIPPPVWTPPQQNPPTWNQPQQNPPTWTQPPQNPPTWTQPQQNVPAWTPPQQNPPTWNPPQQIQPIHSQMPPQNDVSYKPLQDTWTPPKQPVQQSTTSASVIKNEMAYGENGSYKYEYQITDGTHVGEEGYFTNPRGDGKDDNIVKKGFYSFTGADGKVYSVTWWADHTGFHAFGDHLPTPPPVPAAIQTALDQAAKEEAAKAEAEKNKPQQDIYYPPATQKPQVIYNPPQQYPQKPVYQPPPTFYPPQNNYPTYG